MQITIKSKNLEITPAFEVFIGGKLELLKKIIGDTNADIVLEIDRETEHHRHGEVFWASASLNFDGKIFTAQERSGDAKQTAVKVLEELEIELKKYKDKLRDASRKN